MVNSSSNTGKYLMEKWHTDRDKAIRDRSDFTDEELEWLDLDPDTLPPKGLDNPDLYKIDFDPLDPLTARGKKLDMRDDPEIGD